MQRKRSKFRDKKKKIYKKFKNRTAREARKKKKKASDPKDCESARRYQAADHGSKHKGEINGSASVTPSKKNKERNGKKKTEGLSDGNQHRRDAR